MERWLALVVRYWAYNMTLVHNRGTSWPGFGYTDDEKAELRSIAQSYSIIQYYSWLALVVVFALVIFGVVAVAGMQCLLYAIGGEQHMATTPAPLFFLSLALEVTVSLSLGLPLAMLPAAVLTAKFFQVDRKDLPDGLTTAHYFHKLWLQITRITLVLLAISVPLWIFVPGDSKFFVLLKLVIPLLSPAVAALTSVYFLSAHVSKPASKGAS
jgi:hypothetical protein